jgi:hypothetical protein
MLRELEWRGIMCRSGGVATLVYFGIFFIGFLFLTAVHDTVVHCAFPVV